MATKPIITLADLRAKGACSDQVALFEQTFGDSVAVTVAKARKVAPKFDWDWAARHFLTAPAYAEYERVRAPAYAEYERVTAAAFASAYIAQCKGGLS